jgi:hypothetical protein
MTTDHPTGKQLARDTLAWLKDHPDIHSHESYITIYGYSGSGTVSLDDLLPDDGRSEMNTLAAIALVAGCRIRPTYTSIAACEAPDGTSGTVTEVVQKLLGLGPHAMGLLLMGRKEEQLDVLSAFARGTTPQRYADAKLNPEAAQRVLDFIVANPEVHSQSAWYKVPEGYGRPLAPHNAASREKPRCGTTLCVAGAACHVFGYTLTAGNQAVSPDGRYELIDEVAQRLLGLTAPLQSWLFGTDRPEAEVRRGLELMASGHVPIDTYVS